MPYIKQDVRRGLHEGHIMEENPGELNYTLTIICREYMKHKGLSYQTINDILGALEGAKQEFYRRVAAPYEDKKIEENGDVY